MEHFFHIFIPGTPENMALAQMVPALAPMQAYLVSVLGRLRFRKKS